MIDSKSGCTIWAGAKKDSGGLFVVDTRPPRKCTTAQRYAYRFYVGPIPGTETVTSKCGNRLCVTPHHLKLKSRREVIHEAIKRGTWTQVKCRNLPEVKCGEKNPNAKYKDAFVERLQLERRNGAKLIVLASKHGLAVSTVGFLCSKRKGGMIVQPS